MFCSFLVVSLKKKGRRTYKQDKKILTQFLLCTSRVISPYRVLRINKTASKREPNSQSI